MTREHFGLPIAKRRLAFCAYRPSQNGNETFSPAHHSGEITVFSETWTKTATAGSIEVMGNVVEGSA